MLVGGRYTGGLGIGLLMVSGCVRSNPAFEQTASATGGQRGTSAAGSSGSGTTGDAKTGTADEGTTSTSPGSVMSSSGAGSSSSGNMADGTSTTALFDLGQEDPPTIVLYPSAAIAGDFAALAGGVELAGSLECAGSAEEAGLSLDCDEVFPILGWPTQPLGSLDEAHPALGFAPLVNVTGEEVAESLDALLDGTVAADFAELVMEPVGATGDGRFWWGYSGPRDPHCGDWSLLGLQGTTRLFAAGVGTNGARSCVDGYRLLCACIELPG